jgi:putative transcription factor
MAVCEMCGAEERLYKSEIEGSIINVCQECSKFGKVISAVAEPKKDRLKKESKKEEQKVQQRNFIYLVSPEFAKKVKEKREKLGMNQEDFAKKIAEKESVVQKLETGEIKPSLALARKLERLLGIKLIEFYEEETHGETKVSTEGFTIGDIVKIKKKP